MTPNEFKNKRLLLGYSQQALADEWGMGANGGRTIRRWESAERPISPIAAYAIVRMRERPDLQDWQLNALRKKAVKHALIARRLEMLNPTGAPLYIKQWD
jgi:transcriptional regulator with XRE-family HTH domain